MYLLSHESFCLSSRQSVYLSAHQSVFLFVCLCRRLSISNSDLICLSVYLPSDNLSVCVFVYLSISHPSPRTHVFQSMRPIFAKSDLIVGDGFLAIGSQFLALRLIVTHV